MLPTPSADPFTALDFQLVPLRRMADHDPRLVEDARRALGASPARMREAHRRRQVMARSPRSRSVPSRYRPVLGEPESRSPRRVGGLDGEAWRWPVPLRPGLRFEVLAGPGAPCGTSGWSARRAPGLPSCARGRT